MKPFSLASVRAEFPQLDRQVRGHGLVYLDNAATTLKPRKVIDRLSRYYLEETANVHRGAHWLAENGTGLYESSRASVAKFIGSPSSSDIVFTRGTTESLNLIAQTLVLLGQSPGPNRDKGLMAGDEVFVTELEHHSNIVPWQLACERSGAKLRVIPVTEAGEIDLSYLKSEISKKTKVVSFSCCSNVLGTITDTREVAKITKSVGACLVVDAAQMITAERMDVSAWGADVVVFSGHKLFAPFGIGVLWASEGWLDRLPPYQGGGSMIDTVTFEKTTWADAPQKFEAGTPNVGGAVALGEAIEWFRAQDMMGAIAHAKNLAEEARQRLAEISGIRIYGEAKSRTSVVSFNLEGVHASDLGTLLDQQGIAIRAGHHCCQPLMKKLGCSATARASFSIYNQIQDVEALLASVRKAKEILL